MADGDALLDIGFGWADFSRLRCLVADHCAAAGLRGSRLDDFVLAVHEIAANTIAHIGPGGRLILRQGADGIQCLIAGPEPLAGPDLRPRERPEADMPIGALSGRGLWLAVQLADELSVASAPVSPLSPDSTVVTLYMRLRPR